MCSISGIIHKNLNNSEVHNLAKMMNDILIHRGPDKSSTYVDNSTSFAMGMNRLSIMDVNTGNQPFISKDKNPALISNIPL